MINFKIFDGHTHVFPDSISERAITTLSESGGISPYHKGNFSSLLKYEENGGASGFLILPIATKPSQTLAINEFSASKVGNGVEAFGSIHPKSENLDQELDYIVELGLKGIKLHPEYQNFFADDETMYPIYEKIFSRNLIICFHAGVDVAYPPPVKGAGFRIAKVCDKFSEGKIIAAHMGGVYKPDDICDNLMGRKNLWLDTSFCSQIIGADLLKSLILSHGTKRVLFGTDAPWTDFGASKNSLLNSGLSEEILRDIFYNNAINLLE